MEMKVQAAQAVPRQAVTKLSTIVRWIEEALDEQSVQCIYESEVPVVPNILRERENLPDLSNINNSSFSMSDLATITEHLTLDKDKSLNNYMSCSTRSPCCGTTSLGSFSQQESIISTEDKASNLNEANNKINVLLELNVSGFNTICGTNIDDCDSQPCLNGGFCSDAIAGYSCECPPGYTDKPGGSCQECNCNNNADLSRTGKCQKCLYDTEGDHCEYCRDGYYGDASRQNCRRCECDVLGTNGTVQFCDRYTGQCPCLKNVIGTRCDECIENHWKIASGQGCEACDCDRVGSNSENCNPYDGQCDCTQGFGGRACDQCETNFWGDPNVECKDCNCNSYGSATHQCERETGQCVCIQGMEGYKCDQCARGYLGEAPYCSPCGECFDNWDDILNSLSNQTNEIIERAKQIKTQGATGAYTKEFVDVEKKIDIIKMILQNTTVSAQDISEIENMIYNLRKQLTESEVSLKSVMFVYIRL
ncbi:unnamed protein product [Diamesa hyperborea]